MKAAHGSTALRFVSGGYDALLLPCTATCIIGLVLLFAPCANPAGVAASSNH
jgi:hypothetical protein